MASTTLTVMTPALAGQAITGKSALASSETMTVQAATAQGALDFNSLHLRVENVSSTAAVTLTLAASATYSSKGQGSKAITVGTATTVIIGGQDFESARFQNTAGTIVFTQAGTGPTSWEAYQAPRASE